MHEANSYVIVGNGTAGVTAAQNIRRLDPQSAITIVTDEPVPYYSRPGLMYYMMGSLKEWDLHIAKDEGYYRSLGVVLKYDTAVRIREGEDVLELASGESLPFDRLLLATGSNSRTLGVSGEDLDGVRFMYTVTQGKQIMREWRRGMKAVVVGGGLLGAELAEVWCHAGVDVTFLVREPWYFPRGLSEPQGRIAEEAARRAGCDLYVDEEIAELRGSSKVSRVMTKSGKEFQAEAVGVTIGVEPNIELAKASGIATGRGVLVDSALATSRPNVYAAGDCAEIKLADSGRTLIEQLWYSADKQGRAAAFSMCGDPRPYDPGIFFNSAMFFDVDYVSIGSGRYPDDGQDDETLVSPNGRAARRFISRSGVLTGMTSVGANDPAHVVMELVREGASVDKAKARLDSRRWRW